MRLQSSLNTRLSLALIAILTLAGGGFWFVERHSSRLFFEEFTQRLNADIAMYVTGETTLIRDGEVDQEALARLSRQAMIINPSVEIYLLDPEGQVLGHGLPNTPTSLPPVAMTPVTAMLDGRARLPHRGTDPLDPANDKIFSVSPVMHEEQLQGYLYAVLGGQRFAALSADLTGSYWQRSSAAALVAILLFTAASGLLLFGLLTRRLRRLTRNVQRFTRNRFDPQVLLRGPLGRDEIGQLHGAILRMADTIDQQFMRLRDNDQLRRELISNVSHDLRTPLSSMQGYLDTLLLKGEAMSAEQRQEYLSISRKHTLRLRHLIGDLFELSRLDAASMDLATEPFSMAELVHDVAQEFRLQAEQQEVVLKVVVEPGDDRVEADIGLMQRVLENLLRNALQHTPAGGEVRIGLHCGAERVALTLADTGQGIAEAELAHIFDRYYRGAPGQRTGGDSAGLGLAIVKRILDLHGCRISVSSTPGQGTRFEFDLPLRQAA